jgi:hypothetical protein
MNIFVVSVALLTLCNLATFLLSLPSNLMAEKRDARRESSATNKTTLLTQADSSVEQKNAPQENALFLKGSDLMLTQVAKNHLSFATAFFSYF